MFTTKLFTRANKKRNTVPCQCLAEPSHRSEPLTAWRQPARPTSFARRADKSKLAWWHSPRVVLQGPRTVCRRTPQQKNKSFAAKKERRCCFAIHATFAPVSHPAVL